MTVVASVDYPNKRVYLHADTVGVELDTLDVYREVRTLRRVTESHRKYDFMVIAGGNLEKIVGVSYTPAYIQLLYGCRLIPYDANQKLKVIRDTFTDDGFAGRDCFDRTGLSSQIDIDIDFPEIETRVISTGGSALTLEEHDQLMSRPDEAEITDAVWDDSEAVDLITNVQFIKDIEGGRWKIINNQMIFYDATGAGEVARFNLFDKNGSLAEDNIFERVRV